jgi:ATP-binding cassette subfamily B protein
MSKVIEYMKAYTGMLLLAVALLVIQAACDLALPDYMSEIVNKGVAVSDSAFILTCGAKMLGVALLGAAASVIMGFFAAQIAAGVAHDMRLDVFNKVQSFASAEIDQFGSSSLYPQHQRRHANPDAPGDGHQDDYLRADFRGGGCV